MIAGRNALLAGGGTEYWGLTFTAEQAGSTVAFAKTGSPSGTVYLDYSTNGGVTWKNYSVGTVLTLSRAGQRVCFAARAGYTNSAINQSGASSTKYYGFKLTGKVAASGDVSSLRSNNKDTAPAMALSSYCYADLFYNCAALTAAPALPATTLAG